MLIILTVVPGQHKVMRDSRIYNTSAIRILHYPSKRPLKAFLIIVFSQQ